MSAESRQCDPSVAGETAREARTKRTFRLAAVQAAPVWLKRDESIDKACRLIQEAGAQEVDLLAFPEGFIPGHPSWYHYTSASSQLAHGLAVQLFREAVDVPGAATARLCEAAANAGVDVVIGVAERRPGSLGTLFNTQLFITSEGVLADRHQKLVPTHTERLVHSPGGRAEQGTFDSPTLGPLSALLCAENANPLALAHLAAGYPRAHVASWPDHLQRGFNVRDTSLTLSRAVAFILKAYVVSSCGVVAPEMLKALEDASPDLPLLGDPESTGGSCIIDPLGNVVAGPLPGSEEGLVVWDGDVDLCVAGRMGQDFAGHYNRPDVFRLEVRRDAEPLVHESAACYDDGWTTESQMRRDEVGDDHGQP